MRRCTLSIHCEVHQGPAAVLIHTRMAVMGCHGLQYDRNRPRRSNGDLVGSIRCEVRQGLVAPLIHTRMAFRMTGIAPAAAMVTWLAAFIARLDKARQPYSFTSAWPPVWSVMAIRMIRMAPAAATVTRLAFHNRMAVESRPGSRTNQTFSRRHASTGCCFHGFCHG